MRQKLSGLARKDLQGCTGHNVHWKYGGLFIAQSFTQHDLHVSNLNFPTLLLFIVHQSMCLTIIFLSPMCSFKFSKLQLKWYDISYSLYHWRLTSKTLGKCPFFLKTFLLQTTFKVLHSCWIRTVVNHSLRLMKTFLR